jgi:hypothetical protein
MKKYTFSSKNKYSKKGINLVTKYLESLDETLKVINLEEDKRFQDKDIDLLQIKKDVAISIEVKTDDYKSGNFFFETTSNKELETLGCFLKSKAKYFYYYFIKYDTLFILPLKKCQKWFLDNIEEFKEISTSTIGNNGEYSHTTVGRIVEIKRICSEIKEIRKIENISKILR